MGARQQAWAKRVWNEMVEALGGICYHKDCDETDDLQIDHIAGKDWTANKVEWSWRMSIYRKEMKEGKLQLLCQFHNAKKGDPRRHLAKEEEAR